MRSVRSLRPSPALVISVIALVVATAGTGYAAFKLPKNSVGTKQLKSNSVTGAKVKDDSLTGADIKASTLGTVPKATSADSASSASSASNASNADKLGGLAASSFVKQGESIPAEAWHEIGTPGNPAFASNGVCDSSICWGNFGGESTTAAFYRDPSGVVHLKGEVKNEAAPGGLPSPTFSMFTLPVGFRPSQTWSFAAMLLDDAPAGTKLGNVIVGTSGAVFNGAFNSLANGESISLDGITFRAAG